MAIDKQYFKTKSICKVTFTIEKEKINGFNSAFLVGDFNNWENEEIKMKKARNGSFGITIELEPEKKYQFRYLMDKTIWLNEDEADAFVPSPFGDSENSLLIL
jgi:hypothetical protein